MDRENVCGVERERAFGCSVCEVRQRSRRSRKGVWQASVQAHASARGNQRPALIDASTTSVLATSNRGAGCSISTMLIAAVVYAQIRKGLPDKMAHIARVEVALGAGDESLDDAVKLVSARTLVCGGCLWVSLSVALSLSLCFLCLHRTQRARTHAHGWDLMVFSIPSRAGEPTRRAHNTHAHATWSRSNRGLCCTISLQHRLETDARESVCVQGRELHSSGYTAVLLAGLCTDETNVSATAI